MTLKNNVFSLFWNNSALIMPISGQSGLKVLLHTSRLRLEKSLISGNYT